MKRAVLADTGPLYALADPSDQYHARARDELHRLQAAGRSVAVAYPTVCEAYTLVLRHLGLKYSLDWLREVLEGVMAINPEPADYLAAARRIQDYPDQEISLFDAVTAVLTEKLKVPVWAYDHDFDVMGARRWR